MTYNHPHPMFRTGLRRYEKRPPANCRKARAAWDIHAADGPVVWLQLLDGYWGAMRENGDIEEIENLPDLENDARALALTVPPPKTGGKKP